jgi:hypothetical protein
VEELVDSVPEVELAPLVEIDGELDELPVP